MPKTILIVEDFADTRLAVKFMLEGLGYQVVEAENGWQAVEVVKRQRPDLIIMDMALPQVDGLSATKIIRQFKETSEIPIIAFTASGEFIYDQAIQAGCNDLITKPVEINTLQTIIEKHLEQ